jgi:hypothetical protein
MDSLANNRAIWSASADPSSEAAEARRATLRTLEPLFLEQAQNVPRPRTLFAWRSVRSPAEAFDIAHDGMRAMSKHDNGYFAKGLYFALEPALAATYLDDESKAPGRCLLLCLVSIAQPYPVTLKGDYRLDGRGFSTLRGGAINPGHDSHFIPVHEYGQRHPLRPDTLKLTHRVHFQAAATDAGSFWTADGHELCVEHQYQVTPVGLLRPPRRLAVRGRLT